jgi:hypothetical protein
MSKHAQKHLRNRKHKPYGYKSEVGYCSVCDCFPELKVSKKAIRAKAKKEIREERKRILK